MAENKNQEIEREIENLLSEAEDDFAELDDYLDEHEDDYTCDDIYETAFRIAIRLGQTNYIEEHIDDFEMNDCEDSSSYLDETDDEEVLSILMEHGACRSWDYYSDCSFAIDASEGTIISFAPEFQKEVFCTYLEKSGLTEEQILQWLQTGKIDSEADSDYDLTEDLEALGVEEKDGELDFQDLSDLYGYSTKELLEELGWECEFEGDSWQLETTGVYFIK